MVATGATSANFTVTSHTVATITAASISGTLNGATQSAVLTVTPHPGVMSLRLNPTGVVGGSANSIGTVTLNAPAVGTAAQRTVTLASSNTAAATVPASVVVSGGNYSDLYSDVSRGDYDGQSSDYGHVEWIDHGDTGRESIAGRRCYSESDQCGRRVSELDGDSDAECSGGRHCSSKNGDIGKR